MDEIIHTAGQARMMKMMKMCLRDGQDKGTEGLGAKYSYNDIQGKR